MVAAGHRMRTFSGSRPGGSAATARLSVLAGAAPAASRQTHGRVVRVRLGPDRWALARIPALGRGCEPSREEVRRLAGRLVCCYGANAGQRRLAVVRVPDSEIVPDIGPALVVYSAGGTTVYCAAGQIWRAAAEALEVLAGGDGGQIPGEGPSGLVLRLARMEHEQLTGMHRHPGFAGGRGRDVTAWVCADLVTAEIAETLACLADAQACYLLLSTPRAS